MNNRITEISPGDVFNYLTVIEAKDNETNRNKRIIKCVCICGREIELTLRKLIRKTGSCGCNSRNTISITGIKMSGTPEYNSYRNMKTRCYNQKHKSYRWYGAKGIKISDRWLELYGIGFKNFIDDMGYKPTPKHQIDRIDSDKDYGPDNCKWSTHLEQQHNKKGYTKSP